MKLSHRLSVGLVAMLGVVALSGSPAVAADSTTFTVHQQPASAAATESSCAIYRGGYLGHYICGTAFTDIAWSDGRVHTFIIGLDHAVWNIVQYAGGGASGWRSLGGWLQRGVWARYVSSPSNLGIWAYGAGANGGRPYCRNLNPSWQPWYAC